MITVLVILEFHHMKYLALVILPEELKNRTINSNWKPWQVLTTEWVEGEKLSESKSDDLLPLVSTALNCYLMQLLETGFLHADPHPGNLLRTPDGRLCVLDFGLMTQVGKKAIYDIYSFL